MDKAVSRVECPVSHGKKETPIPMDRDNGFKEWRIFNLYIQPVGGSLTNRWLN